MRLFVSGMKGLFVQESFYFFLFFFSFQLLGSRRNAAVMIQPWFLKLLKKLGEKRISVYRAAREYGVPESTLRQSWYQGFIKRWPQIRLAKPARLAIIRAKATSKVVLDAYFNDLETVMKTNNLENAPERIWNVDEYGILMEHTPPKVLCTTGAMPQAVTSPRGKNVTIIGSGNAAGNHIPPYFIFPGMWWNEELLKGTTPGTNGEMSKSGWSNSIIFLNCLQNHFLKFIPQSEGNKHLTIFEGHRSHVSLTLTSWGKEHGIEFFHSASSHHTSNPALRHWLFCSIKGHLQCWMSVYAA